MQGIEFLELVVRVLEGGKISATVVIGQVVVERLMEIEVQRMLQERVNLGHFPTIGFLHHNTGYGFCKESLYQEIGKDEPDAKSDEHSRRVSPKGLLDKWNKIHLCYKNDPSLP
jgi:hypothetical protein